MVEHRLRRIGVGATSALLAAAALGMLYRFPPDRYPFYPACPFSQLTGLQCPGCGSTRALAALLHGDLAAAWHCNALLTLLLPCAVLYLAWPVLRGRRPGPLPAPLTATLVIVAVVFAVIRDLPR